MCFYTNINGIPVHINGNPDGETMDAIGKMIKLAYNFKTKNMEEISCEQEKKSNLDFGQAIIFLKRGEKVCRKGWNGQAMYLWLNKGSIDFKNPDGTSDINEGDLIDGIPEGLFESGDAGTITRLPNINMRSATGSTVTGWLASQTDMLAEDWQVL